MTWRTPDGERWLTGAEADAVRESLARIVDEIYMEMNWSPEEQLWETGVALFDELTKTQPVSYTHLTLPTTPYV